ncbi:MAG TPA: ABC transporter permease [Tenuifilaceae bacterium]|nr:ABC transporter permease [Tenuifilaceae bacterium]
MRTENYIARRFFKGTNGMSLSRPFIRITITSVALSIAVMIVAVAVITGFKQEIKAKVAGFGSHIQITNYDSNQSLETLPLPSNLKCVEDLKAIKGVRHIQVFGIKAGIIKTPSDMQGVALKGVSSDFDWSFFRQNLVEGSIISVSDSTPTNQTLISKTLANLLRLKVGDSYDVFFVQEPPRFRRFVVEGIYDTKMVEFDKLFIICDIGHIRRLNGWSSNQVSGYEVLVDNIEKVDDIAIRVDDAVGYDFLDDGSRLKVQSLTERYSSIFDWLELQNINAAVLIILMLLVAGINMISGLLIIILDKTGTIGLLKALGTNNESIRKIFLLQSAYIMIRGLAIGTIAGIAICLLQKYLGIVKLDEEYYFLSVVPINMVWWHIVLLNLASFIVGLAMMVIPSMVVSRISPDKTLKFD